MLERLVLATAVTFSLYLFLQLSGKTPPNADLVGNMQDTPNFNFGFLIVKK